MRFKATNYSDAIEAGNAIRQYAAKGNRTIELENGRYRLDAELVSTGNNPPPPKRSPWLIPRGTKIEMDTFAVMESKATGSVCQFQLAPGVEIFGGSLMGPLYGDPMFSEVMNPGAPVPVYRGYPHVCVVGIGGDGKAEPGTSRIRGTYIGGGNFQLYFWNSKAVGCGFIGEDLTVAGGRWLFCSGNSGGSNAFESILRRCLFLGDFRMGWSDPADAQGNRLHAISDRGGFTRVIDCEMSLNGAAQTQADGTVQTPTDVRCLWTPQAQSPAGKPSDYEGGNPSAYIYATGTNMVISKNGCAGNVQCLDKGVGTIRALKEEGCTQVVR